MRVIHKITDEYKILVVKTKFSPRENSRLLSAPLVTLGPPLYIPVPNYGRSKITAVLSILLGVLEL